MIRRRHQIFLLLLLIGLSGQWLAAQGSLSEQVLRLLTRANSWSAVQTFVAASTTNLKLERTNNTASTCTDGFENRGGNLYFNCTLVPGSAGTGTVTSIALTAPAIFAVGGSPVTTTGTLALTLATEAANLVWAGPTTGAAAGPTFRSLVAADIPDVSATYLTASSAAALTNKTGAISQWTNDSGYLTTTGTGSTNWVTLGTVVTGTWNASVVAGLYGGTGVANSGKTITLGGNFTTSGAFTTTLTVTGNTNVTLPTTGTLLTSTSTTSALTTVGTIATGVWNGTAVAAAFGGTGLSSYAVGDIIYASASTPTLSKLADVATGNALISGGVTTAPSWGKIALTTHVSGTLPVANGGLAITTVPSNGFLPIGNGATYTAAAITGTANQVTVTNGSGSITLALPQSIATASTPQWTRIGLGAGAGASALITGAGQTDFGFINAGNCGAGVTLNWNSGRVQKTLLNAATCTLVFSNPISGNEYVIHIVQDATGGRVVTFPATVTWAGGSPPVLTAGANKTDVCAFRWNGTAYLANCTQNF